MFPSQQVADLQKKIMPALLNDPPFIHTDSSRKIRARYSERYSELPLIFGQTQVGNTSREKIIEPVRAAQLSSQSVWSDLQINEVIPSWVPVLVAHWYCRAH